MILGNSYLLDVELGHPYFLICDFGIIQDSPYIYIYISNSMERGLKKVTNVIIDCQSWMHVIKVVKAHTSLVARLKVWLELDWQDQDKPSSC